MDKIALLLVLSILPTVHSDNEPIGIQADNSVYNTTIGSVEDLIQPKDIGAAFEVSLIATELKLEGNGTLLSVIIRVGTMELTESTVYIQAWRPIGSNTYKLVNNKELTNLNPGLNKFDTYWRLEQGDYLGVSCSGYCPVQKDTAKGQYLTLVNQTGNMRRQYINDMLLQFSSYPMYSMVALQGILEVNKFYTTTSTVSTTPGPVTLSTALAVKTRGEDSWLIIIAAGFGGILFLVILGGLIFYLCRRKTPHRGASASNGDPDRHLSEQPPEVDEMDAHQPTVQPLPQNVQARTTISYY